MISIMTTKTGNEKGTTDFIKSTLNQTSNSSVDNQQICYIKAKIHIQFLSVFAHQSNSCDTFRVESDTIQVFLKVGCG